jgi:hypothetical protein
MPDTQNIEATSTTERDHDPEIRSTDPTRRAAVIEAAYILEAVRK